MSLHLSAPSVREAVLALTTSPIREVADSAAGRDDVLPFWFGESDQVTPAFIRDAAIASIRAGESFYSNNLGRPYLRQALSTYLSALHGVEIPVPRIAAVSSGVSAVMLVAQALLSPGDRVVAITPLWPNVVEIPRILGATVARVPLEVAHGRWTLDLDRLHDALVPGTRLLIVNSPNNPTGWMLDEAARAAILARCRELGIWILADDVYERLVYDPACPSAPSFLPLCDADDRVVSVNSFSKAWSMTGWRAGWIVAPEPVVAQLAKLVEYNTSCLFEPVQRGATAALEHGEEEVRSLRAKLQRTRTTLAAGLGRLPGVSLPAAGGAMYAYFRLPGLEDSLATAKLLVRDAGLGLAPGIAFGPEGAGWLRWCHAVDDAKLDEGLRRLTAFLAARPGAAG